MSMNKLFHYIVVLLTILTLPVVTVCDGYKISTQSETRQHEASVTKLAPKSFYFIRHGQTDWNIENRLQGQLDIPLNDTGRAQAQSLQSDVSKLDISCVYFSPLSRAQETMELACKNIPAITKIAVPSLMERNFGEWQGELCDQEALTKYRTTVPVNGESEDEYFDRVVNCANDILAVAEGQVLIVAHGGVFWSLCKAAGVDYEAVHNCSILHFVAPHKSCDQWMIYEL